MVLSPAPRGAFVQPSAPKQITTLRPSSECEGQNYKRNLAPETQYRCTSILTRLGCCTIRPGAGPDIGRIDPFKTRRHASVAGLPT